MVRVWLRLLKRRHQPSRWEIKPTIREAPPVMTNSSPRYIRSLSGGRMITTTRATVSASAARILATKVSRRRELGSAAAGAGLGSAFKAVPYAPNGDQVARLRGGRLDLLPQPPRV